MGRGSKEAESEQQKLQQPTQTASYNQPSYQSQSYEQQFNYPVNEAVPAASRAMTESENLARSIKDGTMSGFIGAGTALSGEIAFKAMWRVDGQFSGRMTSEDGTLLVGASGQVDANVEVAVATIIGTVNGDIIATQRIELGRTARVNGNIQTPSLVIEQGAIFEGSCRMLQSIATVEKQQRTATTEASRETTRQERASVVASTTATTSSETTSEAETAAAAEATS
jgi:cytoskeletal protein CcmA (bactofilin family)